MTGMGHAMARSKCYLIKTVKTEEGKNYCKTPLNVDNTTREK